jgi:1,4-alpha-glucan branching enzyme
MPIQPSIPVTYFGDYDKYLFEIGKHFKLYEKLGAHEIEHNGEKGVRFAVFSPAARHIEIIGAFNSWNGKNHPMFVQWNDSGIWECFIPGISKGTAYKYRIYSHNDDIIRDKADPFAFNTELPPATASKIYSDDYKWKDNLWMLQRKKKSFLENPMSIYEVHLGSWKKKENFTKSLSYVEMAKELVDYVKKTGFTHVELLPVMEHPYYPSWGYQSSSYFAPSVRYGDPHELKLLIDTFHKENIGVILDWVPSHFATDGFSLYDFDGSSVYEHPNPKKGYHLDWNSYIFNYERPQIRSFLISSAHYWLDQYHADGLRVDAVASMLYLDYSRNEGQWDPNEHGGNEYLAAIGFLKDLNYSAYTTFEGIDMIAEESTAFAGVTTPVEHGGLGFGLKWMMGWMNDTLKYFAREPIYRKFHQGDISFSMVYAYSENYILPLSHDEVVHGKGSLLNKMPGDEWQKFANLRLLYTYMYTHPGHKLLFMGSELAPYTEWNIDTGLEWDLLEYPNHKGIYETVVSLNRLYESEKSLYEQNFKQEGFEWIDHTDNKNSTLSFIRKAKNGEMMVVVLNFTPVVHEKYEIGVPSKGTYVEVYNSDDKKYWGSGVVNKKLVAKKGEKHGKAYTLSLTLPPLAGIILKIKKK